MSKTNKRDKYGDSEFEKSKPPVRRIKNRRHRRVTKQRVKQGCDDIPDIRETGIPDCQSELEE